MSDDEARPYVAFLYSARILSGGLDETERFATEAAAVAWLRDKIKRSHNGGAAHGHVTGHGYILVNVNQNKGRVTAKRTGAG